MFVEEMEDVSVEVMEMIFIKERQSNVEIQDAYKELIRGIRGLSGDGSTVGVKRMGEVDNKPFLKVCQSIYSDEVTQLEHAALLVSKWQEALRDAKWYPFKRVGTGKEMKEVVDDEDEKLQNLKREWGEDVTNAVKVALEEMNKFNPSGRYEFPVLWNFEYGRKATLKEGISHMMELIKHLKGT